MLHKKQCGLLIWAAFIVASMASCGQASSPAQLAPAPAAIPPATTLAPTESQALPAISPAPVIPSQQSTKAAFPVRILLIHYMGSLQPPGCVTCCCDEGLYERDEFVAIQNNSNTPQNISGWKLINITRGYPSFTFPAYFPCLPLAPSTDPKYVVNTQSYTSNPPQSVESIFATEQSSQEQVTTSDSSASCSGCSPTAPLDETPMAPMAGQQPGRQVPLTLYPGQILLIFTDEIHCKYGGLSFNYGLGNIWNNEQPDTAVLYNARGEEISRKSYTVGR
jgi:hypothetical protein